MKPRGSKKATQFTESVIREMTRLAQEHDAVNLSQGFPDFAAHPAIKDAACSAIQRDINQYPITWGAENLREAIAGDFARRYGVKVRASQVTVCCGSTEAMLSTLLAVLDPGDEVIIFEPYYENYGPDSIISGAVPQFVRLREPDWTFDEGELAAAFNDRTRAIIINTPNNPTGKVFRRKELEQIARLCQEWDCVAITDEIYDHILYDGCEHVRMVTLGGMRERTLTINSLSKTFSVTGWRVGYIVGAPALTDAVRRVHDFLTVGAAHPLQEAGAKALRFDETYFEDLRTKYTGRRDQLLEILTEAGFRCFRPQGAYYIMTDIRDFGFPDDVTFANHLVQQIGVAAVPGSSFYREAKDGEKQIRFCFCKKDETLQEAAKRLRKLKTR